MRTKQVLLRQKNRFLAFGAILVFNVALAGSVCGTFAWYAYATRTGFEKEYHGTTIGELGSLQAGIISDVQLDDYESYFLSEDAMTLEDEGKYIYWCPTNVEARTINYVISHNGSATTSMFPITSSSSLDINQFYKAPTTYHNYEIGNVDSYAEKKDYLHIPFVLRYEDADILGNYLPNYDIYLSAIEVTTSGDDHQIYRAVRNVIYNGEETILLNPTAEEDGSTIVGGPLDLNGDGFYDVDASGYEIIYGEYDNSVYPYNSERETSDGALPIDECTSFIANHKQGTYAVNKDVFVPKTIAYECLDKYVNKIKPISRTNAAYHNLALIDFYTYFEGWDLTVINSEQGHGFNMDLKFEVAV